LPSVSVVLPAYNEEANLPRLIKSLVGVLGRLTDDYEIIIVDDGSRDRTPEVSAELAREYPGVKPVRHQVNKGYGGALWTGFTTASKELVFFTDADNQFDVGEMEKLMALIGSADLVIGYRAPRRDPFYRRLNAHGWNVLVNILFGYTARDVDCAFKLFWRRILDTVQVESRGATFSAELLVRARRAGFTIKEVPVKHLPRLAGQQTGARLRVILRAFRELVAFRQQLGKEQRQVRST
jgi:glycosyltransferase involved in cell wall biosynthesis